MQYLSYIFFLREDVTNKTKKADLNVNIKVLMRNRDEEFSMSVLLFSRASPAAFSLDDQLKFLRWHPAEVLL